VSDFSSAKFESANFTEVDFKGEVKFKESSFPYREHDLKNNLCLLHSKHNEIAIRFDNSIFRNRTQFRGKSEKEEPLELELVSFKGVDLSNVEFSNVRWLESENSSKKLLPTRYKIIDELLLEKRKKGTLQRVQFKYHIYCLT
jgi:uncharacterized protein YjbI with pentapeptide repeats